MKWFRSLAWLGLLALSLGTSGCGKLAVIFAIIPADQGIEPPQATFTVTDATSGQQIIGPTTLTPTNRSICYCLRAAQVVGSSLQCRSLQVDASYFDGFRTTTPLSTGPFTLCPGQHQYVIIDSASGRPTITVSNTNTTGVPVSNCVIVLK